MINLGKRMENLKEFVLWIQISGRPKGMKTIRHRYPCVIGDKAKGRILKRR